MGCLKVSGIASSRLSSHLHHNRTT
jgi:hypothetical protein